MAWVVDGIGTQQRINVLDVGPAMPETVAFLNSTRSQLHVADLLDSAIIDQQHQLDADRLAARFDEALWMLDEPLDVCLFWDFPNYLSLQALAAFNQALKPWVTRHTRAHAFCAVKRSAPVMQHRYGILSPREVIQASAPEHPPAGLPPPWRHVVRALGVFDAVRGTLRRGGIVEVILRGAASQSTIAAKQQAKGNAALDGAQTQTLKPPPVREAPARSAPAEPPVDDSPSSSASGAEFKQAPKPKPEHRRAVG